MGRSKKLKAGRKLAVNISKEQPVPKNLDRGFFEWIPILGWFLKYRRELRKKIHEAAMMKATKKMSKYLGKS